MLKRKMSHVFESVPSQCEIHGLQRLSYATLLLQGNELETFDIQWNKKVPCSLYDWIGKEPGPKKPFCVSHDLYMTLRCSKKMLGTRVPGRVRFGARQEDRGSRFAWFA